MQVPGQVQVPGPEQVLASASVPGVVPEPEPEPEPVLELARAWAPGVVLAPVRALVSESAVVSAQVPALALESALPTPLSGFC